MALASKVRARFVLDLGLTLPSTIAIQLKFSFAGPSRKSEVLAVRYYLIGLTHHSFVPLPKSATPARIHSNTELYDFELSDEDMQKLDALDEGKDGAISWNPVDAD